MAANVHRNPKSLANLMPKWPKGQSGNPGGRPPIPRVAVEAALANSLDAVVTLAQIRDDTKMAPGIRVKACQVLLERAFGKPTKGSIETATPARESMLKLGLLTNEELAILERLLLKASCGGNAKPK